MIKKETVDKIQKLSNIAKTMIDTVETEIYDILSTAKPEDKEKASEVQKDIKGVFEKTRQGENPHELLKNILAKHGYKNPK